MDNPPPRYRSLLNLSNGNNNKTITTMDATRLIPHMIFLADSVKQSGV
jgi:hypothetical protein